MEKRGTIIALLDIHSHILPRVDDGAKNIEESVRILEMMSAQGITHVIATPHFYATNQMMDDFLQKVAGSYRELMRATSEKSVPEIGIGSEVYYFKGIGKSRGISALSLCRSRYILLELFNGTVDNDLLRDLNDIREHLGLIPILAHLERFTGNHGFKKLLPLISDGTVFAQVNADAILDPRERRIARKLISKGYVSFLGTDSHSSEHRPPTMDRALAEIEKMFGNDYKEMFCRNSELLLREVFRKPELPDTSSGVIIP